MKLKNSFTTKCSLCRTTALHGPLPAALARGKARGGDRAPQPPPPTHPPTPHLTPPPLPFPTAALLTCTDHGSGRSGPISCRGHAASARRRTEGRGYVYKYTKKGGEPNKKNGQRAQTNTKKSQFFYPLWRGDETRLPVKNQEGTGTAGTGCGRLLSCQSCALRQPRAPARKGGFVKTRQPSGKR